MDLMLFAGEPERRPLTMSSREIAELTGKRHDNVMADIRNMLETLEDGAALRFQGSYLGANNKALPCFDLPKRETLILVSGYSTELRARIIDRWMELEAAGAPPTMPDLSDPALLTTLLIEHAGKRIEAENRAAKAEAQVEAAKSKVDFYDRFANADGMVGLQVAGRILQQGPNKFVSYLKREHLFYQGGSLVPKAKYRPLGIFDVKPHTDEAGKIHYQTFVTPRGLQYFAKLLGVSLPAEELV